MRIESVSAGAAAPVAEAAKLKKSVEEFEALLIGQMLKSARETGGSWFGSGDDGSTSTTAEYAEEQFAKTIASQGGLGLATMMMKGLQADQARLDARESTDAAQLR